MAELESINIGIVGHIDHGKTTLLQKLTGKWADTHSEELKRGITIKLGYADATIYKSGDTYNIEKGKPIRHVSFVDAPGHEMLMATMLSGAAMVDAAILVIAANEGVKPQTREHLIALQAKKVKDLIVVQNKIDLVSPSEARKNYEEVKELLKGRFDEAKIIPVSAQQEVNLDLVLKAIAELNIPKRNKDVDPIFIVARSFDINKPGTKPGELRGAVLGGTLKQGILKVGEEIEIKPGRVVKEGDKFRYEPLCTRILGLSRGSGKVKVLEPGGSTSIETNLDMSLAKGDALSGRVVSRIGLLPESTTLVKIKYELFREVFGLGGELKVEPIKKGEMLMLSVNTSTTGGAVISIGKNDIEMDLKVPIVPSKGDNVGIARNINGHWRLIGYGEIV